MNARGTARLYAGLQTGMAGGLTMLGWMALVTLWSRNSVWFFPNLLATTFGGDLALQSQFNRFSLAGIALHLVQYSLLGAAFALAVPERTPYTRLLLAGLITGLGYYYLMFGFVLKILDPLIPLYSPDRQILVGHIFYGLMLARLPKYRNRLAAGNE